MTAQSKESDLLAAFSAANHDAGEKNAFLVFPSADKPQNTSLALSDRLSLVRRWMLQKSLSPLQLAAMGADPWYAHPPYEQRMQAAVVASLRELADRFEQHGVELGLAQALLIDQVLDQKAD